MKWTLLVVRLPADPSRHRAVSLAERGDGEVVLLDAAGRDEANAARLEGLFAAARQAEWAEFLADPSQVRGGPVGATRPTSEGVL